ncbi:hypothetical protein JXA05_02315 [Candidatus Peregrinibacteria bacterium]|nr:hypothetical protein [Candidatus Peregrinibacteria bacterium]
MIKEAPSNGSSMTNRELIKEILDFFVRRSELLPLATSFVTKLDELEELGIPDNSTKPEMVEAIRSFIRRLSKVSYSSELKHVIFNPETELWEGYRPDCSVKNPFGKDTSYDE